MQEVRFSRIYTYPVKSCGGVASQRAALDERGLRHDRRRMLVDAGGRFLSQRRLPRMALISVSITGDSLVMDAPGMSSLALPLEPAPADLGPLTPVRIFDEHATGAVEGAEADRWFGEFLGVECKLVYMPDEVERPVDPRYARSTDLVSFADGFPLLIFSEASLADLNSRLPEPGTEDRFRPNLLVSGGEPFREDGWRRLRIGGVELRVAKPCSRCVITTVDPATAEGGEEPLRTLSGYRRAGDKVMFGQNLIHDAVGELEVGEVVRVLDRALDGA
ncbi:MOSC domain-containing protein [soil metagenome]